MVRSSRHGLIANDASAVQRRSADDEWQSSAGAVMGDSEGKGMTMAAALSAMLRWICRAAIGLLLTLAAATPSFAEIGCFEDAVRHSEEASTGGAADAVQAPAADDERGSPSDRTTHCSFGHCPHWVPVAPPQRAGQAVEFGGPTYPPFLAPARSQSVLGGPERPPRA